MRQYLQCSGRGANLPGTVVQGSLSKRRGRESCITTELPPGGDDIDLYVVAMGSELLAGPAYRSAYIQGNVCATRALHWLGFLISGQ